MGRYSSGHSQRNIRRDTVKERRAVKCTVTTQDPSLAAYALDGLPLTLAIIDSEGTICWTNQTWDDASRDAASELQDETPGAVGQNYLAVSDVEDEHAQRAYEGLQALLAGEREEFTLEYPCHTPEKKQWFLLWAAPFETDGERFVTVAHFDVTDRVLAEREVAEAAAETTKERDYLALLNRLVRHDIRNDVQLLVSHAEILETRIPDDAQTHLDTVLEQATHIVELTESVKELEQAITGTEEPALSPVSLGAVLRSEMDKLRSTYLASGNSVTISEPDETWFECEVLANEMLSSVFGNLLSNAVIHHDSEDIHIDISVERTDETVVVSIADDGPGIPDSDWETVFGRGEIGLESPGTGVGLYLVDTLVDIYDGSVWISNNEPRGTVFHVELNVAGPDS